MVCRKSASRSGQSPQGVDVAAKRSDRSTGRTSPSDVAGGAPDADLVEMRWLVDASGP